MLSFKNTLKDIAYILYDLLIWLKENSISDVNVILAMASLQGLS